MADKLDMENRDPNEINSHVQVAFDDVFGEPEGAHSIDCVWRCSYTCFSCCLGLCYKILTILCAIPCAFCWGCKFACTAFCHIWYITPIIRAMSIECGAIRKIYQMCLDGFLAPICESCGACFSRIRVVNATE